MNRPAEWSDITAALGRAVSRRRSELRLTQEQLAERAGLSRNQVQNIENSRNNIDGTANPKLDTLWALAVALEVEVSELFTT